MNYSRNPDKIIRSLEEDIRDNRFLWDNELVVWGYWTLDKNGREVFFDYFRLDEEIEDCPYDQNGDPWNKVADWDKRVAQTHDQFFRKKMIGSELLKILKKEYQSR